MLLFQESPRQKSFARTADSYIKGRLGEEFGHFRSNRYNSLSDVDLLSRTMEGFTEKLDRPIVQFDCTEFLAKTYKWKADKGAERKAEEEAACPSEIKVQMHGHLRGTSDQGPNTASVQGVTAKRKWGSWK